MKNTIINKIVNDILKTSSASMDKKEALKFIDEIDNYTKKIKDECKRQIDACKTPEEVYKDVYYINKNIMHHLQNAFKDATNRPSTDLAQKRTKEYIEEISKELFNKYLSFMKEIGGITRKIVKDEIDQAEKELSERTKAKAGLAASKRPWIPWLRR